MYQCRFNIHCSNVYLQTAFRENKRQAIKSTKQVWEKKEKKQLIGTIKERRRERRWEEKKSVGWTEGGVSSPLC